MADAVLRRYVANGGRISRRDTARSLNALAMLGEKHAGITLLHRTTFRNMQGTPNHPHTRQFYEQKSDKIWP